MVLGEADCDVINFQGIHSVGAIIAYQMERLFNNASKDKAQKLKFLILWLQKLKDEHRRLTNLSSSKYLFHALELSFATAIKNADSLSLVQKNKLNKCSVMKTVFDKSMEADCLYLGRE